MIDKIYAIKQRFNEVNDLIIQPDIMADAKRYVKLNREYKELKMEMQVVFADFVDEADSENVAGQYAADVVLGRHKIT